MSAVGVRSADTNAATKHPAWCELRNHWGGEWPDHLAEIGHLEFAAKTGHGEARVEVSLVQPIGEAPAVMLYVSECDGSECDDRECVAGDGEMVELTADMAREVIAQLSQAVRLLGGQVHASPEARREPNPSDQIPSSLAGAA